MVVYRIIFFSQSERLSVYQLRRSDLTNELGDELIDDFENTVRLYPQDDRIEERFIKNQLG